MGVQLQSASLSLQIINMMDIITAVVGVPASVLARLQN